MFKQQSHATGFHLIHSVLTLCNAVNETQNPSNSGL